MKRALLLLSGICGVALIAAGCSKKNPGSPTSPIPIDELGKQTISYVTKGDTISMIYPNCECDSTEVDARPLVRTLPFSIANNQLSIVVQHIEGLGESKANVDILLVYDRLSGKGLNGQWLLDTTTYKADRALTSLDSSQIELVLSDITVDVYQYLDIEKNSINMYFDKTVLQSFATRYIENWNSCCMHNYNMTVDSIAPNSVLVTAQTTGETIVVARAENGDIWYTSSNPDHPQHIYYRAPDVCPNPEYPAWMLKEVLVDNKL